MARIIINSDDFGLSPIVNKSISQAFDRNLISSTTTLVNFNEGLKDAKRLINEDKIPIDSIGIHLNLTEGYPTNPKTANFKLLCQDKKFHGQIRNKPVFVLDKMHKAAILLELESQIEKFIYEFGFKPSHIDGHHHIHTEWAIMDCVIELAKKYQITKIRLSRNIGDGISLRKRIYKKLLNSRLKLSGIITTDYFGDFEDLKNFRIKKGDCLELMVHAIPSKYANQIDDLDHQSLNAKVDDLKKFYQYELINYSSL